MSNCTWCPFKKFVIHTTPTVGGFISDKLFIYVLQNYIRTVIFFLVSILHWSIHLWSQLKNLWVFWYPLSPTEKKFSSSFVCDSCHTKNPKKTALSIPQEELSNIEWRRQIVSLTAFTAGPFSWGVSYGFNSPDPSYMIGLNPSYDYLKYSEGLLKKPAKLGWDKTISRPSN
jgi:hypothetical protein